MLLWETYTGRQLAAPQSHLQAVTVLAVDSSNAFLLSGSEDSNVLVWALSDLLTFRGQSALAQHESITPRHTLAAHRSGITALVVGHSGTNAGIAVTASKDETAVIWDYSTGTRLRTFLLSSAPLCIVLDPADRGFYAGYEDGSVQLVDFYAASTGSIRDAAHASTPLQPSTSSRWSPPNTEVGAALSISLSYDATTLFSGHSSGRILSWDIAAGVFRSTVADYPGAAITTLQFLAPTGFPSTRPPGIKPATVIKPKPHEYFSSLKGRLSEAYVVNVQLSSILPEASHRNRSYTSSEFMQTLTAPIIPASLINACISDLTTSVPPPPSTALTSALSPAADHISLTSSTTPTQTASEELSYLRKQVAHLKELQTVSSKHLEDLARETVALRKKEEAWTARRRRKEEQRLRKVEESWEALKTENLRAASGKVKPVVNGASVGNGGVKKRYGKEEEKRVIVGMDIDGDDDEEEELSSMTSTSEESESDDG